ncbi:MAG: hypothetical protein WC480_00675 [Patescibacteria group bacterium]
MKPKRGSQKIEVDFLYVVMPRAHRVVFVATQDVPHGVNLEKVVQKYVLNELKKAGEGHRFFWYRLDNHMRPPRNRPRPGDFHVLQVYYGSTANRDATKDMSQPDSKWLRQAVHALLRQLAA